MIVFGEEARDKMLAGIQLVARAVKPTLGPMAKTVVLKEHGRPIIVNDGVTVAKAVSHEDEFVNMGAKLLIEVATQAQNIAGDGTTTACVLAEQFCLKGMKEIEKGRNPVHVVEELNKVVDEFCSIIEDISIPVEDKLAQVATIAANNDAETKRPLLLISRTLEQHAISNLIVNIMNGAIKCCAIECPDYGEHSNEVLKDLAELTQGKFFDRDAGDKLEDVNIEDLGTAEMVKVSDVSTLIVGGKGDVSSRVENITSKLESAPNDWVADKMRSRIAKLEGGVAVLHVGAISEIEMRDKKERIDDALNATRAAMEMGIVAGGGHHHLKMSTGNYGWVKEAFKEPAYVIANNAGMQNLVVESPLAGRGLNARTGEQVDLLDAGIVDPAKVVISSVKSAASVASLVLTSEVLVGEENVMPEM
jgi:chaperonin GroEL (HSP60 family)